ncbi:SAM-dependent methyltransferase [Ereboglobus sp. PH5-10]|uniref:class I SAM-dependent methyltransferase n=1 Tax=Ereboglobus sp. PH5-10 TaxID=2940629 RepID=UPI0024057A07|nr:class I SAM-dependent methyltransferase [Ereboglobus sp. PH5-10]MDF9826185.1 SAM-dependent methyltransferase [Ereboglobus sp. PH5-10]
MSTSPKKITSATVRDDFNDPNTVIHYARAAHFLGLWKSESILIQRFFTNRDAALLEAGCGAGRVTVGLHDLGYRNITAFDFAEELVDQARSLVDERAPGANIRVRHADATRLRKADGFGGAPRFEGALFMFNGLMQIPGRKNRIAALLELRAVCKPGAPLLFTTHDREVGGAGERILWRMEADRWAEGRQDPCLVEFGDRYFEHETGRTFMHLPTRAEILADLAVTGWRHTFDALRSKVSAESRAVRDFSDECRFWSAVAA